MNNNLRLSRRLEKIASFLKQGTMFADIGSDHAYLPCYVCLHDEHARAIAGEVRKGPFERAQETVSRFGLSDRVDVRFGDGLQILNEREVTSVVIAGMGGPLIKTILDKGANRLDGVEQIIAQPNIDERRVRHWFVSHGYTIADETMVEEKGHIYEIIIGVNEGSIQDLTEKQLLFGPYLLKQKPDLFYHKWKHEHDKRIRTLEQMKKASVPDKEKIAAFAKELTWIEEELSHDNDSA
ncbi:tRNA (adenine(22)-N(1))-methyltransferase [Lentibacillus jeotgali]|uniref:tRNA (adenine(22)-N(1))-methyltransferase n=1 Tax=Lentibacillus jeotgali TaxID=558169 RepID=UPI0002626459|nr:class I SAM-dependent methyltransferase [Lentibacillus jeotgali]